MSLDVTRYLLPGQKLESSCSQARLESLNIYTGNERAIVWFLFFESVVLVVFAGLRSLQLRKKAFDRTITELQQKAAEEAVANDVIHELGDLVQKREGMERKLSTIYSLGRDEAGSSSKFLIPLYDRWFNKELLVPKC
ncbi:protein GAMETE EXPRESSED 3 [Tripterygium wilfordii]|uniref:Protein GAMETE EXPRESSED 3 n=1 Tax=Tripterygium wilfordii TaxID=458696 RepID=A0A7J7DV09_TRIWF|nr:protein GAMETE EXPRESSED 3 [Tripterygium wilfordii]